MESTICDAQKRERANEVHLFDLQVRNTIANENEN